MHYVFKSVTKNYFKLLEVFYRETFKIVTAVPYVAELRGIPLMHTF